MNSGKTRRRSRQTLAWEMPFAHQDALQDQLRAAVGPGFTLVLSGSGGARGEWDYHLQIVQEKSGYSIESHGRFQGAAAADLQVLALEMRRLLEAQYQAQHGQGSVRWLSRMRDVQGEKPLSSAVADLLGQGCE